MLIGHLEVVVHSVEAIGAVGASEPVDRQARAMNRGVIAVTTGIGCVSPEREVSYETEGDRNCPLEGREAGGLEIRNVH
jgi:hypothetical protein